MKVIKRDIVEPPTQIGNDGYTPVLKCNQSRMAVKFSAIQTKIDGRSGKVIEQVPKFLKEGDAGVVKMIPTEPMVVETLSEYPPLGRFDVEDKKQTVAVGVIMSVDKGSSDTMAAAKKKVSKLAAKKKGAK